MTVTQSLLYDSWSSSEQFLCVWPLEMIFLKYGKYPPFSKWNKPFLQTKFREKACKETSHTKTWWADYRGRILKHWRRGCWDFVLNSWHSIGQNGDFSSIVLSLSICVSSFSLSFDGFNRFWHQRKTDSWHSPSFYNPCHTFRSSFRSVGTTVRGTGRRRDGSDVAYGLLLYAVLSLISGQKQMHSKRTGRAIDRCEAALCIVLTMTAAIVATHQCCSLCWVLLFVSRPSALISSLSRSESTWDSCKDTALSITCCACLWGWRSLLCLFSLFRANHTLFLGRRSCFKETLEL